MKLTTVITALILVLMYSGKLTAQNQKFGIVIHGGAGYITPGSIPDDLAKLYTKSLKNALDKGYKLLKNGGSAVDAVELVVSMLEDDTLFNAGKGAVFTEDFKNELDASIMNGADLNCGAVARLHHIKNPVKLARAVMNKSSHVFLAGDGAEKFAKEEKIEMVSAEYFKVWSRMPNEMKQKMPDKHGTVGCVALDKNGNLAAATSTGGIEGKKYGRIGDVPVIGAGTYANNNTCAISCTGQGEYFIRNNVAYDISAQMEYKGVTLAQATDYTLFKRMKRTGGVGGVIGIDKMGNIILKFSTEGMFRGYKLSNGDYQVLLYKGQK